MQLDQYQAAAAHTDEPRVIVSAVPGSGKTRTLAARYLYMTQDKLILPHNIVLLTFTRYAANEMKQRIGETATRGAFLGTFHSFALRLIRMYADRLGWEEEWLTILDAAETELDEREVLKDLRVRFKRSEWDRFKKHLLSGTEDKGSGASKTLECTRAWKCFEDRLRSENVLTFGTLILEAIRLLSEHEDCRTELRRRFRHFLIDEAQDTDANQWKLVDLFEPKTRFVVGDIDQSIFEWRGAAPHLFRQYAETAARFDLPNSYRFGFNIATPANTLIRRNVDRLDTAINAIASNSGSVNVVRGALYEDIAETIGKELDGCRPEDVAVLARRHDTLTHLSDRMKSADIPHEKIGGATAIPASSEFRAVRGYLRIAVNPMDRQAFMAIAASEHLSESKIMDIRRRALSDRCNLLTAYTADLERELPQTLPETVDYLKKVDPDNDYTPATDYLQQIAFHEAIPDTHTDDLVQLLAMESAQDQLRHVSKEVTLCTIHAAKGLEWPVVFLIGLNASQFPSKRSMGEGRLEEERRLCYVAMTRAEETLYMVHNAPRVGADQESMFMGEMEDPE